MTTSVGPFVIDYLAAQCQASPLLGGAAPPVAVFDGPHLSDDQLTAKQKLWIGFDLLNPGEPAMESEQQFANLDQGRTRDETGHVVCSAEDSSGDTTMKAHRDAVQALMGTVELLMRGLPSTGGPGDITMGGLIFWSQITSATWYQRQLSGGTAMACVFKISYFARLTT